MANAMGAFFIFLFVAIVATGTIAVFAFISQNNNMTVGSTATNVQEYLSNTSVVNHTQAFVENATVTASTVISPLPLLCAIFALAAGIMVVLVVVTRR